MFASALLAAVIIYDAVHKRTPLALLLMAACRFLLYLVAASTALASSRLSTIPSPATSTAVWPALALAAYIAGLSYLARRESISNSVALRIWPIALLFAPVLLAVVRRAEGGPWRWMPLAAVVAW